MKRFILYIFCGISLLHNTSCTKNYELYNTDRNGATDGDLNYDNLRLGSLISQMQVKMIPSQNLAENADVNAYQLMHSLMGDIYSGHQGASNAFGNNGVNNTTYSMTPEWYGSAFAYTFQNEMAPWYNIKQSAAKVGAGANSTYAVAQIMKVLAMHRLSDIYGPLPYLNFVPATSVPYNSQEVIYASFFAELDSAIATLNKTIQITQQQSSPSLAPYDLIYRGNLSRWVKFGNSLKLRLAMRIVRADAGKARLYAEQAVSGGVLDSNDDNARLLTDGNSTINPLYMICYSYNDTRMGATMESYLKGYKDPRIGLLFNQGTGSLSGDYHGIRNGSRFNGQAYSPFSTLNVTAATPIQWMGAGEVYFLRAEGALRGWNMGGMAGSLYEQGVRLAFGQPLGGTQRAAGDASAYLSDGVSTPAPYVDPLNSGNNAAAPSTITIRWNSAASFEENLERIITQKWISLYPDGLEAWSEFRRTGYPKVIPIPAANNLSNGQISTSLQVRRSPFPQSEYRNNSTNVSAGVSLLGGPDNGGTPLWWDRRR
ncbi:SusD/RagB family nutrient-binding outer membrane lipoprotein [Chitinophaga pendula]|uniref:RagB/SusD family nutrient uptake outer membrane protein n=1 Tax=Chitinophaga TaxID=79328 RepID=UPI000BB01C86|nr:MULTISPECIES: RagB/SusD family nutrient uptake outer membrane protein [Chitinophaga]ASZ14960.1 SusD/RagB family nutrient-binding outer membrane lipoprotein [Chitinophaga sp. MD30]UCJ10168.1 SusD/RagB family nutrient-binding outer membrane lipoprotein [Chitinophaga pendula]